MTSAALMLQTLQEEIRETQKFVAQLRHRRRKPTLNTDECPLICKELETVVKPPRVDHEDIRLNLINFPRDLGVLSKNKRLLDMFERHFHNVVQTSDFPLLYEMYALPSAVVLIPESAWQQTFAIIAQRGDLQKLKDAWEMDTADVSEDIKRERRQIISRISAAPILI